MGDFSRDSFKSTNVLNNLLELVDTSVNKAKHYVGVRLQQGVPVLDADWNEAEDIRRMELLALIRFYIGNGVPAGNNGFQITTTDIDDENNFRITGGIVMVNGFMEINQQSVTYQDQPDSVELPELTTPADDRTDIVYVDVWEEEVSGDGSGDERLIDNRIGVETSVRIRRVWTVRVHENANDLSSIVKENRHHYLPLARLNRRKDEARITSDMIVDLRRTGITLAEHLKVPVSLQMGREKLDKSRFAQMLTGFRTSLFARLKAQLLPYKTETDKDENILLIALQEVMSRAQIGEVQAASRNMDNRDGMIFMENFYSVQKDFIDLLKSIGNKDDEAEDFVSKYLKYLDGSSDDFIKGLKLAIDNQNLMAAVLAQERLNGFLSAPVTNLPEGSVNVFFQSVNPFEKLVADKEYAFSYEIESRVTSSRENEDFDIEAEISNSSWTVVPDQMKINFANLGGKETIIITVKTPPLSSPPLSSILNVTAVAERNRRIRSSQIEIELSIGEEPPVGNFFFYAGPELNPQNKLELNQASLTGTDALELLFILTNNNNSENRKYRINYYINPDATDLNGWKPSFDSPESEDIEVEAGNSVSYFVSIRGPVSPPEPLSGTTGVIVASATLIGIDDELIDDGAEAEVKIDFIVEN